ncbi:hypothetical protein, partial [Priestia megaterium]|uniref:hypothetical protein n=1 Tax=Priestia megaterium TaxID=1404 RepID=UPI001F479283
MRWRKDFWKGKSFCFSHVDTFFHSFNFFAFDVPVFSAQGIRSPPSPLRLSSLTDSTNGFNRVI